MGQVTVPSALADQPVRDEFATTITACGTSILEEFVLDGEQLHKAKKDGSVLGTGVLKVRFTNEATGQSVLANVSGPGTFSTLEDGTVLLVAEGRGGGPDLLGGITLAAGPGVVAFYPDGSIAVLDYSPHHWDLCPLLT
jgi:hypothetical protein